MMRPSLKTSPRMTEGTKRGAGEARTGTEDVDGAETLTTRPGNQGASLL